MTPWRWSLHWQVLLGMAIGCFAGYLSGEVFPAEGERADFIGYDLIGGLFMNALKMLIIPLVMSSIIFAMGSLGKRQGFAKMGWKTLLFYAFTSFFAIMAGLILVNLIRPGEGTGLNPEDFTRDVAVEGSAEAKSMAKLKAKTQGKDDLDSTLNVFRELIPSNIVGAMANLKMLGVIFFSLLFGFFINRISDSRRHALLEVIGGFHDVIVEMTFFILKFLPIGVGCLIAKTSAQTFASGLVLERLSQLSMFALTVVLALGFHLFIVLPLMLIVIGKVSPAAHFRAVSQAMLTAFSTASSAATLPVTLQCLKEKAKVSERVGSFVLPVGATVNMDGTALYECVAVMFLAQLSGIEMSFMLQLNVVALALLTSIGVAGIPSASLVAIMIILNSVNANLPDGQMIPIEALAILMIFDRLLDMCRTSVNITGDTVGAVIIAKSEGEKIYQND